jgi:hypothetical protein
MIEPNDNNIAAWLLAPFCVHCGKEPGKGTRHCLECLKACNKVAAGRFIESPCYKNWRIVQNGSWNSS